MLIVKGLRVEPLILYEEGHTTIYICLLIPRCSMQAVAKIVVIVTARMLGFRVGMIC